MYRRNSRGTGLRCRVSDQPSTSAIRRPRHPEHEAPDEDRGIVPAGCRPPWPRHTPALRRAWRTASPLHTSTVLDDGPMTSPAYPDSITAFTPLPGTLAFIGSREFAKECLAARLGGLPSSSFLSHQIINGHNASSHVFHPDDRGMWVDRSFWLKRKSEGGSLGSVRLCSGGTLFCFPSRYKHVKASIYCMHTPES